MFQNTPMWQILLAALLLSSPFIVIAQFKGSKLPEPLARECERLRFRMIGLGVVLVVLLFALPDTAVLPEIFGNPTSLEPHLLLQHLQENNRALVRTTEVLHWLIFFLLWWLVASLFYFSKALRSAREPIASSATIAR